MHTASLSAGGSSRNRHAEPPRGCHALHDSARGVPDAAVPLHGPGRHRGRLADRESHARGDRRADRVLRQHARDADGPRRGSDVPRVAAAGARAVARRLRASGRAVREARRGAAARPRPQPQPALPGQLRGAERAGPGCSIWRDLAVRLFDAGSAATRFDLELHVWEREGTFTTLFWYSTDLFGATTIERMAQHFVALLESAIARPERRIVRARAAHTGRGAATRSSSWNDTATAEPIHPSVQRMIRSPGGGDAGPRRGRVRRGAADVSRA